LQAVNARDVQRTAAFYFATVALKKIAQPESE
jgi:hypothetical protein